MAGINILRKKIGNSHWVTSEYTHSTEIRQQTCHQDTLDSSPDKIS